MVKKPITGKRYWTCLAPENIGLGDNPRPFIWEAVVTRQRGEDIYDLHGEHTNYKGRAHISQLFRTYDEAKKMYWVALASHLTRLSIELQLGIQELKDHLRVK